MSTWLLLVAFLLMQNFALGEGKTQPPRPLWLDGKMPDRPNTRFVVVPTATFSDHHRAAEALEVEIHHAWREFAKQLAIEHRIPLSFSQEIPTEIFGEATVDRYFETIEDGAAHLVRGHALIELSTELSTRLTSNLVQQVTHRRLQLGYAGIGMVVVCLGGMYIGLRMLGGQPEPIARNISHTI